MPPFLNNSGPTFYNTSIRLIHPPDPQSLPSEFVLAGGASPPPDPPFTFVQMRRLRPPTHPLMIDSVGERLRPPEPLLYLLARKPPGKFAAPYHHATFTHYPYVYPGNNKVLLFWEGEWGGVTG